MLYVVATPIGNLEDITRRALRVLEEADIILSEDTRKSGQLLRHFGIKKKPISFYAYNEAKKTPWVIGELKNGKTVALISNAGTPGVSDPGHHLMQECIKEKVNFSITPGPSAVTSALLLSGFAPDRFLFLGFLPRKKGKKSKILKEVLATKSTLIIFESPYRVADTLSRIQEVFGQRKVALVREMTKIYEEVVRGSAKELLEKFEGRTLKGECVILIDNNH